MRDLNFPRQYDFDYRTVEDKVAIFDPIRRKYVQLTPEEWVRQNLVQYCVQYLNYPPGLIVIEKYLDYHGTQFRADVVVHNRQAQPLLMAECKAPEVNITQDVFDQIARYNRVLRTKYLVVTNGVTHYCYAIDHERGEYDFLNALPRYEEL